jgi:hypothetical protein
MREVDPIKGVPKRCRLSWLNNSAVVYERKCGWGGGGGCGVSAFEYSSAHGAQINSGDLAPYLTYGLIPTRYPTSPFSTSGFQSAI